MIKLFSQASVVLKMNPLVAFEDIKGQGEEPFIQQ